MGRDEVIPYDTTARDQRRADREHRITSKRREYRHGRAARQVACEQVGLTLKTASPTVADDFGDGTGDYIAKPVPLAVQLEGRLVFEETQRMNSEYLRDQARQREKKAHKTTTDRPTDRAGER